MTVEALIAFDLLAGVAVTVAWLGAGAAAAGRRSGLALALSGVAVAVTLAWCGLAIPLAAAGWWFVQEKVTLTLPLAVAGALVAAALAAPRLITSVRHRTGVTSPPRPAVVVPLLGAGYAAAAGPVITLLAGYPAAPGTALITLAVIGAAVLMTWRIVCGSLPWPQVTVTTALAVALLGSGLAFLPADASDPGGGPAIGTPEHPGGHAAGGGDASHGMAPRVPVTALRGPSTPGAGGVIRRFTLTARTATIRLSSGREVQAWTFDGRVPGPPITATEGDLIEVRLRNADIAPGVTLHWHGYDVPSGEDGVPGLTQEAVLPGREFGYRFRAGQVGTYWYHTHEVSDRGVRMGLYGTLIVTARPASRTPPATAGSSGAHAGVISADDPPGISRQAGLDLPLPVHTFAGATVLGVHDQPFGRRVRPGAPVRLRLINTDNTPHLFALTGTSYRVASIDGRDLERPGELGRTRLRLPAGGRYDLVFPMPGDPAALLVDGRPALRLTPAGPAGPAPSTVPEAGGAPAEDTSGWPEFDPLAYGMPAATPFGAGSRFDRRFTLVLDRGLAMSGGRPLYAHTVNGHAFPSIPAQLVREGDLVRVTVVNRGRETHPWHLHGHTVLVLARDGRAPTGAPLWLDTFDVRPGEVWEVAFRAGNRGIWMNHCHNLSHADLGMALHLNYEHVTTPFHGAHGG